MQANETNGSLPLLYVDDSADYRALVKEAILLTGTHFAFYEADGMESAVPYLQSDGLSKQHPRPALILLDYDLGDHTAADFLYWLRLIKKISSIPVVVFGGSVDTRNIAECYSTGANNFISKPIDLARLKIIVRTLHLGLVSLNRQGPIRFLQEYQPDPRKHAMMAELS